MKKFYYDLVIEILAVFVGVTVAFLIDDYKDTSISRNKVETYFGMLKNELSKDTIDFNKNKTILRNESRLIEKLIVALDRGQYGEFQLRMKNFGGDELFYAKADLIEHIVESPDFSTIYKEKLFGKLNNLKEDSRTYNMITDKVFQLQEEIRDAYLKNEIEGSEVSKQNLNHLTFLLYKYGEAVQYKRVLNVTLKEEYLECIGELG